MKRAGALLISGILATTSIGTTPICATEADIISEEVSLPTVNSIIRSDTADSTGIVDTTNPIDPAKLYDLVAHASYEFKWRDENSELQSFEWQPEADDIREVENFLISPDSLHKLYYINVSEPERMIQEQAGEDYHLLQNDFSDEVLDMFKEWGWYGAPVMDVDLFCQAGKDSSVLENWEWFKTYTYANTDHMTYYVDPNKLPTVEQVEKIMRCVYLNLYYPDSAGKERQTLILDYIPGTLSDIHISGTVYNGILDMEPYYEQVKDTYQLSVTSGIKSNLALDDSKCEVNLGNFNTEGGEPGFTDTISMPVIEAGVLPDLPDTIGEYVLIDERTGRELASGMVETDQATLTYQVDQLSIQDGEESKKVNTVKGISILDFNKVKAAVEEQTGIEMESDFIMDNYKFEYRPELKSETNNWTPYLENGEKIYIYTKTDSEPVVEKQEMYRLYNPNSGEHFYTANAAERDHLKSLGWNYEGTGWTAPASSDRPVYRVYNPNAGDHHYTMNQAERDHLVSIGWNDEGIGWYSADDNGVPLYRQYNPNAKAGAHNYTTNAAERDHLVSLGWNDEGIGWYGLK